MPAKETEGVCAWGWGGGREGRERDAQPLHGKCRDAEGSTKLGPGTQSRMYSKVLTTGMTIFPGHWTVSRGA